MKETIQQLSLTERILFSKNRKEITRLDLPMPIFVMRDHDGAGKIWDQAYVDGIISQATLIHIDAHDDLAFRTPLPTSFAQLQAGNYEVGSFIIPRAVTGIIGKMYWVIPRGMQHHYGQPPMPQMNNPVIRYPESLQHEAVSAALQLEVTREIPVVTADLLDLDLDFFTYNLSGYIPDYVLKLRIKQYLNKVFSSIQKPKIITIATSPGYIQCNRERPVLEAALEAVQTFFSSAR